MKFVSVKDVDSDMDVLEDEGDMDSELEESRPSNPRPTRNGLMAAKQMGDLFSMSSWAVYLLSIDLTCGILWVCIWCLFDHPRCKLQQSKYPYLICPNYYLYVYRYIFFSFRKRNKIHWEHAGWWQWWGKHFHRHIRYIQLLSVSKEQSFFFFLKIFFVFSVSPISLHLPLYSKPTIGISRRPKQLKRQVCTLYRVIA